MAPTVPLELQLLVIDLAIPPLTRKNLGEARALMRRLPLVDRAWRKHVCAKLPVVPKLILENAEADLGALERFEEVVERAGRAVQHCELDLRRWAGLYVAGYSLKSALRRFKIAWINLPWTYNSRPLEHLDGLTRVSIDHGLDDAPPCIRASADARLEHVAFARANLARVDLSRSPIKTIALDECYRINADRVLRGLPSLEVLGVAASLDSAAVLAASGSFPPTLRHALFSFEDDSFVQHELLADLSFPSTLETLTLRHRADDCPSKTDSPSLLDLCLGYMREACAKSGTVFTVIEAPEDDSAFDVEAWALSVGG